MSGAIAYKWCGLLLATFLLKGVSLSVYAAKQKEALVMV